MSSGRSFADDVIVAAFCILIAVVLVETLGIFRGSSGVSIGIAVICVLVLVIFRSRIKRKVGEALH